MGDIVTFTQARGTDRTWVPKAEESWWIAFWGRQGVPAARWADYEKWGGFFPPHPETVGDLMWYPQTRSFTRRSR